MENNEDRDDDEVAGIATRLGMITCADVDPPARLLAAAALQMPLAADLELCMILTYPLNTIDDDDVADKMTTYLPFVPQKTKGKKWTVT